MLMTKILTSMTWYEILSVDGGLRFIAFTHVKLYSSGVNTVCYEKYLH
jgi:hypothetical protein